LSSGLFLDLNAFFASCEQQEAPALRGKPVIVVQTLTDSAVAIAASYAAKAFGIKTGTVVHEARRTNARYRNPSTIFIIVLVSFALGLHPRCAAALQSIEQVLDFIWKSMGRRWQYTS
jgi:nucleotidyltransferase/DNA polymerase involved in DNA repair